VGIGAVKDRETRRGGEEDKMGRWKTPESPVLFFFFYHIGMAIPKVL
jgi:hypothetical protein